jgi:hypothetical protein
MTTAHERDVPTETTEPEKRGCLYFTCHPHEIAAVGLDGVTSKGDTVPSQDIPSHIRAAINEIRGWVNERLEEDRQDLLSALQ